MAAKRIRRDGEREAWFYGGIALCFVVAVWTLMNPYKPLIRYGIPVFDGAIAVMLFVWMRRTSGIVECPSCNGTMHGVAAGRRAILCTYCGEFGVVTGHTIEKPAPDHVAERPVFAAILPSQPAWPAECCLCDRRATRDLEVAITTPARVAIRAPHCDEHAGGVTLMRPDDQLHIVIAFRRHAAYVRFAALNGTTPVQL